MKKFCPTCKQEKESTEFRKDRSRQDGLVSMCKPCKRIKEERWRSENRESKREKQRKYYKENAESIRIKRQANYNPIKNKARWMARKIPTEKCIFCELVGERHHPDYSLPLDIVFLCKSHHKRVHDGSINLPPAS